MATQRYISTSFWDDGWVQDLDSIEKLFYIYLLTCPLTNIAGIYKITDKRIQFDLGFSKEAVVVMWDRFSAKVGRLGEWVIIVSWPNHQNWQKKDTVRQGIDRCLKDTPRDVLIEAAKIGYRYPIGTIPDGTSKAEGDPSYSNSNSNSNSNLDSKKAKKARAKKKVFDKDGFELVETVDTVLVVYRDGMSKHLPAPAWPNREKQYDALREMVTITHEIAPDSAIPDPEDFAREILKAFQQKKSNGGGEYWKGASWEPLTVLRRFGELVTELGQKHEKGKKREAMNQAYRDFKAKVEEGRG